ncbi:hypothetical protein [Rhodopirellula sp. MGV]|uniref:hypothetical protein n=1 Tax=Rhodopirellula sp. MGV TaxID=2023130 RepID=UPI000B97556F|nr:hypothetical protein [Rhodopirellula sp. MGV]OYP29384.1 hypothetical protein CGZ80_24550 [Rhodopirellula sp. MGV]PNY35690.1 hypothetical protein C2E31_16505 [Rhodopirellula baltica]
MSRPAIEVIDEEFSNAISELFDFYCDSEIQPKIMTRRESAELLHCEADACCTNKEMVTSSIGICGSGLRCSIGLLTHAQTISKLCQGSAQCPTDWAGELANQLAGRFKNRIAAYDVSCQMGLPVSVRGLQLGFTTGCDQQTIQAVRLDFGVVIVLLHVNVDPALSWEHHPDLVSADEGSLHFF